MITLSSKKLFVVLVACSLVVMGSAWLAEIFYGMPDGPPVPGFIRRRVSMINEANVPAWYTSLLLFAASLLLYAAHQSRGADSRDGGRWVSLAVIFLFLSMDEAVAWHETTGLFIRKLGLPGGFAEFQWIFAGTAFVAIMAVWFLPWVLRQERRTRNLFLAAAGIFLTGALAMEPLTSGIAASTGPESAAYATGRAISDLLEMLGVSVFIFGLLEHLASRSGQIRIDLT